MVASDVIIGRTAVIVKGAGTYASHTILYRIDTWNDWAGRASNDGFPPQVHRRGIGAESERHAAAGS